MLLKSHFQTLNHIVTLLTFKPLIMLVLLRTGSRKIMITFAASFLLMITACTYDNEEDLYPPQLTDSIPCDTVQLTYSNDIRFILDQKCATPACHNSGGQDPDLSMFPTAEAAAAVLFEKATDASHASRFSWTRCEKEQLRVWCLHPLN